MKRELKSIEGAARILASIRGYKILLLTHRNADPDAVASILTLKVYLEDLKNTVHVAFPEGLSLLSKELLNKLGLYHTIELAVISGTYDYYIVVDTNNLVQLGKYDKLINSNRLIIIDHHKPGELYRLAKYPIVFSNITSTSELIALILYRIWHIPAKYATLLISGMLYDTKHLNIVDQYTFKTLDLLINVYKGDYYVARKILRREPDLSEKIARIKGIIRARFYRANNYIVAITYVSAHESSVANALLELGTDIAFVVSNKDGITRIVSRAKKEFIEKTGLSLGSYIMPKLAEILSGSGGGHDAAAVVEMKNNREFDELAKTITRLLEERIGKLRRVVG
ncbi:MAG: DHH family phosphoesterase [Thermoprotei archaeon]